MSETKKLTEEPLDEKGSDSPRASSQLQEQSNLDTGQPAAQAIEAGGTAAPAKSDVKPVSMLQLFRFSTRTEALLDWVGLLAAAAAGASQPLMSLLFGRLTQNFVNFAMSLGSSSDPRTQAEQLQIIAAAFKHESALNASYLVYLGIGMFVCTYVYMTIWAYTGEVNAKRIRELYFRAVLRQDVAYFDNVGAGEITTRIQADTHLVQQGISEKIPLSVSYLAAFIAGYILAFIRCWQLALAMSSILPCVAVATGIFGTFIAKYTQMSLQYGAESGTVAEEVISTVRTAQAFGIQRVLANLYDSHVLKSRAVDLTTAIWQGIYISFWTFLLYAAYALAFNFGTTLINHGHADAGQVVSVVLAIITGTFSIGALGPELQAVGQACGAAAKLYEAIDRVPLIDSASPEGLKPEQCTGAISLEHVDFNYPSRPNVPILKDLSITFPVGKTSALVGTSGSGKSTVISLIERFYDPLQGSVKLDGVDLKELNLTWLRSQIGLVSQEPVLFSTTIKANVAHGLIGTRYESASEEEKFKLIKDACVMANAHDFISRLPLGYNTVVGEHGILLSGGQKQRIAIARAIVADPRILLLDEATSALDTQSEGVVQNALEKAARGRTTITIAHRLSTIRDADCIFVISSGAVVQSGTHQELLADADGLYAHFVNAQLLRDARADQPVQGTTAVEDELVALGADEKGTLKGAWQEAMPVLNKERLEGDAPTAESGKKKAYSVSEVIGRLAYLNRESWKRYLLGSLAAIANGAAYPCAGIIFALGVTGFSDQTNAQRRFDGDRNALWLFVIAIAGTIVTTIQHICFGSTAADLAAKLRSLTFRAILRQDVVYFDKEENNTGQLTSSLSEKPQKINNLAGVTFTVVVQSIATVIVGSVLGLAFVWQIGLVGIACTPVLLSAGYVRLRVVVLKDERNKKAYETSAQIACEAAGSIRTVASLTREEECHRLYRESLQEPLRRTTTAALLSNALFSFTQAVSFWIIALIFWYGSILIADQKHTPFQFFVGLMSTTFSAINAGSVFSVIPDIATATNAAADLFRLFDSEPEIDADNSDGQTPKDVQGRLQFENVSFRYPTRPDIQVLNNLSLTVEPGTYVALVGASGCGKSTTIQLIERFYDPVSGAIFFDGQPITRFNVSEYRKHIALVSQEPTLYAGTIRFNVLLGATKPHEEVTQEEIEAVCRSANILEFIQSLPDGFDTQVGGKGSQLSGGQKQRIAIARALLRNPKVLLLDEATSALDSSSEKVVQEALDSAAKGRTTIAIAHRLSTIQNADRIYFIKDGAVAEAGTHEELLALKGGYYELVQLQAHS